VESNAHSAAERRQDIMSYLAIPKSKTPKHLDKRAAFAYLPYFLQVATSTGKATPRYVSTLRLGSEKKSWRRARDLAGVPGH